MNTERIEYLYGRSMKGTATPEELDEFVYLLSLPENESQAKDLLQAAFMQEKVLTDIPETTAEGILQAIYALDQDRPVAKRSLLRNLWVRVAVAAVISMLLVGTWYMMQQQDKPKMAEKVIAPGGNHATLTLADGRIVALDTLALGSVAGQRGIQITKKEDGLLAYANDGAASVTPEINQLTTPRGGQFQLILPDGSKVWLNSASSIRYPTAFTGKERNVSITGEAYFEVAKDASKPFTVSINKETSVEVLGTHFNINAYGDEPEIKTTLLEGSVKVSKGNTRQLLHPGQQAQIAAGMDGIKLVNKVDTDQVIAWKEGRFELGGNTIEPIMRQVSRWYNVDIEYKGDKPTDNFMGGTSREADVSTLLKILEQTNAVKFTVDGRKITVSK